MSKRCFDVCVSLGALLILAPILAAIASAVRLSSPGPILYAATRVGRFGDHFTLLKFRSMVASADQIGPGVTGAADPRITRVGMVLRRTKLDELPQLINVLRGDMSIVGPRPEDPRYVALYTNEQRRVLNVRPGITSAASIRYRNEEALLSSNNWEQYYIQHVMPAKIAIDLKYAEKATFWQDMRIIAGTIVALFK